MISAYEFRFKEEYKERYRDYKRDHKILFIEGDKSLVLFTKSNSYIERVNIPLSHIDIDNVPFGGCCTVSIRPTKWTEGKVRTNVCFLVHRALIPQLESRELRYLHALESMHGNLDVILNIQYSEDVDTHAKVYASFTKHQD